MGLLSASTAAFRLFRGSTVTSPSCLEEDRLQLAQFWERLVDQLKQVESLVSRLPLDNPSIFQAQSLLFGTIKLVQILEKTATYAERVRREDSSQVEAYYPKLRALATPIIQLTKSFIIKKSAVETFRYLGALEIVSYNLRSLARGYHRLVTDSLDYLPPELQEEAVPIKQTVDDSITQLLTAYDVSI